MTWKGLEKFLSCEIQDGTHLFSVNREGNIWVRFEAWISNSIQVEEGGKGIKGRGNGLLGETSVILFNVTKDHQNKLLPTQHTCLASTMYLARCQALAGCNPMDCGPPGFSVQEIFQARVLELIAISFSRGSSRPRDWTRVSSVSCTGGQVLYLSHHLGSSASVKYWGYENHSHWSPAIWRLRITEYWDFDVSCQWFYSSAFLGSVLLNYRCYAS